jgi:glycerol-3-phosphate acyltransferase PlsY
VRVASCRLGATLLSAAAVGYLAGTIPSADIATRLAPGSVDLRATGSNNPGALNAAQQLGTRWGIAVLVADAAKGALGAQVGRRIAGDAGTYIAATMTIAGHIWPVWSGFRGGKGVATSAGACLAAFPAYFPIDAGVAAVSAASSRNAETSVRISAAAWTVTSIVWWRRGWRNGWGPQPTTGLPLFAAVSSALILFKFAAAKRTQAQA